jgi:hypothetical protein
MKSYAALCDHVSQERWNERDNWTDRARQFICFAAKVATPPQLPRQLGFQVCSLNKPAEARTTRVAGVVTSMNGDGTPSVKK